MAESVVEHLERYWGMPPRPNKDQAITWVRIRFDNFGKEVEKRMKEKDPQPEVMVDVIWTRAYLVTLKMLEKYPSPHDRYGFRSPDPKVLFEGASYVFFWQDPEKVIAKLRRRLLRRYELMKAYSGKVE
jgi:hypothetical protein